MYVKFPGGTRSPGGYIVPCEFIRQVAGGAMVRLSDVSGEHHWVQYVRDNQLMTDEEAERG
jgi:hypothetical protein